VITGNREATRVPAALQGGEDFYEDLCSTTSAGSRGVIKEQGDELQVMFASAYLYSDT